jgi:hypothetical protein
MISFKSLFARVPSPPHSDGGRIDCGQSPKGCKGAMHFAAGIFAGGFNSRANQAERNASQSAIGNTTTRYCIFPLDTTSTPAQNPRNFFRGFPVEGIGAVKRKRFAANGGP